MPSGDDERAGQLAGVDAALQDWQQGDCVLGQEWFVHRADPDCVLADGAVQEELVAMDVRGLVVLSQSCDVVRDCATRHYVEVAPLVELEASKVREVKLGKRPRYGFIPALEGDRLVADLDRTMTVEKPVLVGWEKVRGCRTDKESRDFAQALSRKRARFAFPNEFTGWAAPLIERLSDKHNRNSREGRALRALREVRVRAVPDWNAPGIELMFWFIPLDDAPDFEGASWGEYLKAWLDLIPPNERFRVINGQVATLDDLTARDYVESDMLDLDHLSSRR